MSLKSLISSSVVLAGPTAVGKTAVAVEMSRQRPYTFEIVSADSVQVYRRFDIGSAKPTSFVREVVPFHLVDEVAPDADFTVADYVELASAAITDILRRGRIPLIVGGAGLYIRSLIKGFGLPSASPNQRLRDALEEEAAKSGTPALHRQLLEVDHESAKRIHENDLKRIIRALEVFKATGRPLSSWHEEDRQRMDHIPLAYFALDQNRQTLYSRIDLRVEDMYRSGLVEEVAGLRAEGYPANLKPMSSVGYLQANQVYDGKITLEEGIELTKNVTHQYARRQLIWFRREPASWIDVENEPADSVASTVLNMMPMDR